MNSPPQVLCFGVEEEFLLADAQTRTAVPRAPEVIEKAEAWLGERVQHELYATQVEFTTRPQISAAELRADLVQGREVGARAAASAGCVLAASGSAVLTERPLPIFDEPRYRRMARRFAHVIDAMDCESSACHIHVGTLERGEALSLANHLRPWLPVLQSLMANSPFAAGVDRECASWRHFALQAWPTVDPAPVLDDPEAYERALRQLLDAGTIMDRKMIYWYARPSEHLPTLEIRIADVNADLDVTMLYAVLVRGLATTLLQDVRTGVPCPVPDDRRLLRAHEDAARGGWPEAGTDVVPGTVRSNGVGGLAHLICRARPGLQAAGDMRLVEQLFGAVAARGTGARQQRAAFRRHRSWRDVVDSVTIAPLRLRPFPDR